MLSVRCWGGIATRSGPGVQREVSVLLTLLRMPKWLLPQRRPGWSAAAASESLDEPNRRDDFRYLPDVVPPVWLRPTVLAEVEYRQQLRDGLRHAALKDVRPDRRPRAL